MSGEPEIKHERKQMKYAFDLPPVIKEIAEWQLANYRSEKNQLADLKKEKIQISASNYDGYVVNGSSKGEPRPTERDAIIITSDPYIRRMEIGINAVERALDQADQTDLRLISLVYWAKTNNVEGASIKCNLSKSAAYQRLNVILGYIACGMGFFKYDDIKAKRRLIG